MTQQQDHLHTYTEAEDHAECPVLACFWNGTAVWSASDGRYLNYTEIKERSI